MKFGFNVVAFIAAGVCAFNFLIAVAFLKESNKKVPKGLTLQMIKDAIGQVSFAS